MQVTERDRNLFRIVGFIRKPEPGDSWMKYHSETQSMLMRYLRETTPMTYREIFEYFGYSLKTGSDFENYTLKINETTYKQFKEQLNGA